jgi:hypothetical protein
MVSVLWRLWRLRLLLGLERGGWGFGWGLMGSKVSLLGSGVVVVDVSELGLEG